MSTFISCAGLCACVSALFRVQLKLCFEHKKSEYSAQQPLRLLTNLLSYWWWVLFHHIDQLMHQAIHFVALSGEVKNTLTIPYIFITGCLVKHKYFCCSSSPSSTTLRRGPGLPIHSSFPSVSNLLHACFCSRYIYVIFYLISPYLV